MSKYHLTLKFHSERLSSPCLVLVLVNVQISRIVGEPD